MNTPQEIFAALAVQQERTPPEARGRWALLVTFEEMDNLVDHLSAHPELGIAIDEAHAQHIKEGKAMLHINGTPILPELIELPAEHERARSN